MVDFPQAQVLSLQPTRSIMLKVRAAMFWRNDTITGQDPSLRSQSQTVG